jgi:hypothetical protein
MSDTDDKPLSDETPSAQPAPSPEERVRQAEGRTLVLSWLLSAALHVLLFVVLFLTPWLVGRGTQDGELLIASTQLLDRSDPQIPSPAPRVPAPTPAATDVPQVTPKEFDVPHELGAAPKSDLAVIGIGTSGGDIGKFGLTTGSGGGPKFFGVGGRARGARNIVYVVDRSGSMLATFDAVRDELIRSISALRRGQKFHVILFSSGEPVEKPPKALVPAIESQKQATFEFLRTIEPQGSTNPIPAMQRAFELHPDLIFFLTDGDFDPELLDRLRLWNKDKKIRVSTIAYLSLSGKPLLERISREHNGEFRFVSEHDLP